MSYRAWEPNAIGSVVPPFGGANGGGGGGGQTQDHQAPVIIVGNALSGDALFVCDFLDPGDGSGIEAALAAATAKRGAIWIRAGVYDFNLGTVTGPLTIPTSWAVLGASASSVELVARHTGEQELFILDPDSELRDVQITGQAATGAVTGTQYVTALDRTVLRSVRFDVTTDANGTIKSALACSGPDVRVDGCEFSVLGQNQSLAIVGTAVGTMIVGCRFTVDNGALLLIGDDAVVADCVGSGARFADVTGSRVGLDNVSWDVARGIGQPAAGQACVTLADCALATISHLRLSNPFGVLERGIQLGGLAAVVESRSIVSACVLRGFAVGVLVDANQQNDIVLGNTIQGATTPVSDLGTGTNVASNVF